MRLDCVVINLDRQPERYAAFVAANDKCGLTISRFSAAEGAAVDERSAHAIATRGDFTAGAIGCALSHSTLWQRAAASTRPTVIFEDDTWLRSDISDALPKVLDRLDSGWDLLLLGFNTNAELVVSRDGGIARFAGLPRFPSTEFLREFQASRDDVAPMRLLNAFGTCGYVVSPKGAGRLLAACLPVRPIEYLVGGRRVPTFATGIDGMMNAAYAQLEAYVCFPPLVMTPNDQAASTTLAFGVRLKAALRDRRLSASDLAISFSVRRADVERWFTLASAGEIGPDRALGTAVERWIRSGATYARSPTADVPQGSPVGA